MFDLAEDEWVNDIVQLMIVWFIAVTASGIALLAYGGLLGGL